MRTLLCCLLFLVVACEDNTDPAVNERSADAGVVTEPDQTQAAPTEQMLAAPPQGFIRSFQFNDERSRLSDFVPEGESDTSWTQKVSFESFVNDIGADPINMLDDEVRRDQQRCDFVQHFNVYSGFENGYPTSVRLFHCGNNQFVGRGEVKMIKTMQGAEHFYLVRVLARINPFEMNKPEFSAEQIAAWTEYLRRIRLCDNRIPERSCDTAAN